MSVSATLSAFEELEEQIQALIADYDALYAEKQHIAEVLATFHRSTLSASSLQPVLELALQLNPELK